MTETLRDVVDRQLGRVTPPEPDLDEVLRRGRRLRRARRTRCLVALGTTGAVVVGAALVLNLAGEQASPAPDYPRLASFDLSEGMRAYASPDPGGPIHLGDRSYPTTGMEYLDTDAVATRFGMVFFDRDQKPRLLGSDGVVVALGAGPSSPTKGFNPSSKTDSTNDDVAWTEAHGDHVEVVVHDLASRTTVATRDVPCGSSACTKVKIDGLDRGVAFVRTPTGTYVWRTTDDRWTQLGGPELRVADVRAGTLLYDGPAPTLRTREWRYVPGPVDAQLTFDGRHVLNWSNVLRPTVRGARPITLDQGAPDRLAWYTVDTDGSILMAVARLSADGETVESTSDVYDCLVPSGRCTAIGEVVTESGDPMFIGNDM